MFEHYSLVRFKSNSERLRMLHKRETRRSRVSATVGEDLRKERQGELVRSSDGLENYFKNWLEFLVNFYVSKHNPLNSKPKYCPLFIYLRKEKRKIIKINSLVSICAK